MEPLTRTDVETIIQDKMAGPLVRIEASVFIIETNIKHIQDHMAIANGNTARNVERIEIAHSKIVELEKSLPHTIINCPQTPLLSELKTFTDEVKAKKEGVAEFKASVKGKLDQRRANTMKVISTIGVTIAALALLTNLAFSIIGYFQRQGIQQEAITSSINQ